MTSTWPPEWTPRAKPAPRPRLHSDYAVSNAAIELLQHNQCRWPHGDPDTVFFHFCQHNHTGDRRRPYCHFHQLVSRVGHSRAVQIWNAVWKRIAAEVVRACATDGQRRARRGRGAPVEGAEHAGPLTTGASTNRKRQGPDSKRKAGNP